MSRANILNTGTTNYLELIAELAPGEWTLALLEERPAGIRGASRASLAVGFHAGVCALVVCPLNKLTVQLPWARHGGLQSAPENRRFRGLVGHGRRCKAISQTYH